MPPPIVRQHPAVPIGSISDGLTAAQNKLARLLFAFDLAVRTKLDPRVIYAWLLAEGPQATEERRPFNYLNLATPPSRGDNSYSGVPFLNFSITRDGNKTPGFYNAKDAATETAYYINRFGNFSGIRSSTRQGPLNQAEAIQNSDWAADHYGGGPGNPGRVEILTQDVIAGKYGKFPSRPPKGFSNVHTGNGILSYLPFYGISFPGLPHPVRDIKRVGEDIGGGIEHGFIFLGQEIIYSIGLLAGMTMMLAGIAIVLFGAFGSRRPVATPARFVVRQATRKTPPPKPTPAPRPARAVSSTASTPPPGPKPSPIIVPPKRRTRVREG